MNKALALLILVSLVSVSFPAGESYLVVAWDYSSSPPSSYSMFAYGQAIYQQNITVAAGSRVRFQITVPSTAGTHGINIEGTNVNKALQAGKTTGIVFTAPDTPGSYAFSCSAACGTGPFPASGYIIVN